MSHTSPQLSARLPRLPLILTLALAVALGACKKEEAAPDQAAGPATGQAAAPQPAVSDSVAAMSPEQLREAASAALREQRLYAPAGNNAMEYYLALRDKAPNDPAVASALTDLMPYALIAAEQSIAREDIAEAKRLYALMQKADPKAPALPRLQQTIAQQEQALAQRAQQEEQRTEEEQRRQAELERQRQEQQRQAQEEAARQLAAQQAAQREAEQRAAAQREAEQRTAAQPQPAQPQPAQPQPAAPQPAAASAPRTAGATTLRPISTPAPTYPPEALRAGRSGQVQVEFTVGVDGTVTDARVINADPPRVFDRAALAAVRRWRFQPVSEPVTTRRTIAFNPGG
ncbi:energy transducer TonB [Vulcaniibacterium gelatinicum]|uniref:energy transducer TonB n=1 Tax=Vulcaniibacterium gelatinicum TaxID=2598725 RepID=UPI0011C84964|nr:energy transducer TonB [Vulcaniibacterium gelatinicum]